jgi:hypothetical protein
VQASYLKSKPRNKENVISNGRIGKLKEEVAGPTRPIEWTAVAPTIYQQLRRHFSG